MNEYEMVIGWGDDKEYTVTVQATSYADAERVCRLTWHNHKEILSIKMLHRGIVPHDLSSGTSES